ncbi:MAG: YIP1 family protein [Verrucomicrobiota bacterium]
MLPTPEPASAPPPPASSPAGRLLNVFAAPGDVFNEVKTAGVANANWLIPAVLLILASWVSAALIFSQPAIRQQMSELADKAIDQQVEKGKMSSDQAEKVKPTAEKMAVTAAAISATAGAPAVAFALPFWWGLILWLGGKVLNGSFSYMKAVEVAGLANMILVLDVVVRTLLILVTGNVFASPSLALAVKDFDPQNTLHALCALVNVMLFWVLVVRSIGLAWLSGASVGKAAVWVFGIWAAYTGMLIGLGAALRAAFVH